MQRSFKSGSRQAPDPFDQFLEDHNFYRKHTARDSSCLFRVISEQMYDTQLHHSIIREKCVTYMRKHRSFFDIIIGVDFDAYLAEMSKSKTYGTLLELQAAGYMFQRNILLFEPFTLGTNFNENNAAFSEFFRVFYTPEKHFDSVFTSEYIQEAATCQSLCYEILYKDLFKLPDIYFAVEHMLYGYSFENLKYGVETNSEGYCTRLYMEDGREFDLDLPQNTNCILENYRLCHFHHHNFPKYSDDLKRKLLNAYSDGCERNNLLMRANESFLPNKYISCVRQLLLEGITPFPYKVAKALDPNIYRNIEFDAWNEIRKEMKLENWYNGDTNFKFISYRTQRVPKLLQVGAKCHVKLYKSEQGVYTCHIQEIAVDKGYCVVFIEQLGEKRLVPYESLSPLPAEQFKPWSLPYRFQRHLHKYSSVRFMRHCNYRLKLNSSANRELRDAEGITDEIYANNMFEEQNCRYYPSHNLHGPYYEAATNASFYKFKQYSHLQNFRTHTVEYCTIPILVGKKIITTENFNKDLKLLPSGLNNCFQVYPVHSTNLYNNVMDSHFRRDANNNIAIDSNELNVISDKAGVICESKIYPINSYTVGLSDNCYGHIYNNNMQFSLPTLMSPTNCVGSVIYSYNNPINIHLPPSSTKLLSTNNESVISQTSPYDLQTSNTLSAFYETPILTSVNECTSSVHVCTTSALTASNQNYSNKSITNINDRITCYAQKSYNINGTDLPTDVTTLRYFYNIGVDCYYSHLKQENDKVNVKIEGKQEVQEDHTKNDYAMSESIKTEDEGSENRIKFSKYNSQCSKDAQISDSINNSKINSGKICSVGKEREILRNNCTYLNLQNYSQNIIKSPRCHNPNGIAYSDENKIDFKNIYSDYSTENKQHTRTCGNVVNTVTVSSSNTYINNHTEDHPFVELGNITPNAGGVLLQSLPPYATFGINEPSALTETSDLRFSALPFLMKEINPTPCIEACVNADFIANRTYDTGNNLHYIMSPTVLPLFSTSTATVTPLTFAEATVHYSGQTSPAMVNFVPQAISNMTSSMVFSTALIASPNVNPMIWCVPALHHASCTPISGSRTDIAVVPQTNYV